MIVGRLYISYLLRSMLGIIGITVPMIACSMIYGQFVFANSTLAPIVFPVNDNIDIVLVDRHHQVSLNMTSHPAMDIEPSISADGRYLTFQSDREGADIGTESDIYIIDLRTGKTRQLTAQRGADSYPRWSPDGHYVAFRSEGFSGRWPTLLVVDVETGKITRLFETVRGERPFEWSPDGSRLAFVTYRNKTEIHVVTFPDRKRSKLIGDSEHNYLYPRWVDNSTVLASVDNSDDTRIEVTLK